MSRRSKAGRLNRHGRRRLVLRLLLIVLGLLGLGVGLYQLWDPELLPANRPAAVWYDEQHVSKALVHFPRDDAPHDNLTEWWYYNGHLHTTDGRRYSFHVALFLIDRLARFTVLHATFLDLQTGQHFSLQQRTAGTPGSPVAGGFDFALGAWRIAGADGRDRIDIETPEFTLALDLVSTTPPILHGETGLLDFEQAGSSYYYSRPRMTVSGRAGPAGAVRPVEGLVWFDHQWGDFSVRAMGWNWFALQLDDGRDIMLFELFTPDGQPLVHYGTVSQQDVLHTLGAEDFTTRPTGRWRSPATGTVFPMGWTLKIPSLGLDLKLQPVFEHAEFDGRQTSYMIYWEGPIRISGSQTGLGFVELSGYGSTP
jgi:predicted secreted hydrolase